MSDWFGRGFRKWESKHARESTSLKLEAEKMEAKLKAMEETLRKFSGISGSSGYKPYTPYLCKECGSAHHTTHAEIPTAMNQNGMIIHKGASEYSSPYDDCTRYLVISKDVWLQIDDNGQPIEGTESDPWGRIHSEKMCPRRKR